MNDLREVLRRGTLLVSDGAIGTMLQQRGLQFGECPELWNADRAEDVKAVHKAYVEAGANLISTNTFGGTRKKLGQFGVEDRFQEVNSAGVILAKDAASDKAWVMGSIGPVGELLEPYGDMTEEEAVLLYRDLSQILASSGADALLYETFYDTAELKIAVESGRATGLPVFATMTFDQNGRTMMGMDASTAWNTVKQWGLDAFGVNCSTGPEHMVPVIGQMKDAGAVILIAQPNAGMPETQADGSLLYKETPESLASYVPELHRAGCRIFGSCCGSTPDHTRKICEGVKALGV